MEHRIVIERLYKLGDYQNIKIIAETSGIPDEVWEDADKLREVRDSLEQEVVASFAQHMLIMEANKDNFKSGNFQTVYNENA